MKKIAEANGLIPEFEVTFPFSFCFTTLGSTEEYWGRQDAAQAIALLLWEGLGLGEGSGVGNWSRYHMVVVCVITSKNYLYDNIDYNLCGQNIEKGLARTKLSHMFARDMT
ncbi:hypothetical protein BHE74_00012918 [Ensete ventricosum]|uniref:Uncharacterized protein n=1 Tax=Ensete ventricosum TaxID=4639 RepID=A0A427AEC0_ENSVE|nr:hypothetical protein B296_00026229 [Ensete ventricosum]RWW78836.1 hypothetical protein BHE74_00012918 [Ensete ventricosum]RZR73144.1 hypothetical protein BHM03_00020784 [Ensete ventricosum]